MTEFKEFEWYFKFAIGLVIKDYFNHIRMNLFQSIFLIQSQ
jgi:hypothetical protein